MDKKNKSKKNNTILLFIAGFLTLILVPTLVSVIFSGNEAFSSFQRYFKSIGYGFSIGLFFWLGNWAIGALTGKKLNWLKNPNRANLITLLSFILYGIIISIAFPYVVHKYVFHHEGQTLRYSVAYNAFLALSVDLIVMSVFYTKHLVHYWQKAINKYEDVKREHLIAKYEALKNQVNPHFLFNSLNTLTGIVEQDQEKAVHFIKKLSDTYRYVLEQRDKELVALNEEMGFVESFIYLAKMRHGDGLVVSVDVKSRHKFVLPLALQILVENCIKHNIISDDMPLRVSITENGSVIIVKNNVQRKKVVQEKAPLGLENLKKRYAYLTEEPVEIINNEENFEVKIPLIEPTDELPNN